MGLIWRILRRERDDDSLDSNSERALTTFAALEDALKDRSTGLYRRGAERGPETLWPFTNAGAAANALASFGTGRPRTIEHTLADWTRGLELYRRGEALGSDNSRDVPLVFESSPTPPTGKGGDAYFDDNCWVALVLLGQFNLTADPRLLARAERVFSFVLTGWSTDPRWVTPGGIRWAEPSWSETRNTCVNGPAAEVAMLLHEATGSPDYLEWAARLYDWTTAALRGGDGLYGDYIDRDGQVAPEVWSYNQGAMIGAGVLLERATSDPRYLDEAEETALAATDRFKDRDELDRQGPAFNSIYFRNLFLLERLRPEPAYRRQLLEYVSRTWRRARSKTDGLFVGNAPTLNATAGMVSLAALAAGSSPRP